MRPAARWLTVGLCALAPGSGLGSGLAAQVPGAVLSEDKISADAGFGAGLGLENGDSFGSALCTVSDVNGDGRRELVVGANERDTGGADQGSLWLLLSSAGGFEGGEVEIGEGAGGFDGSLSPDDRFGTSVCEVLLGGEPALAVGASGDDGAGNAAGAVWIFPLSVNGAAGSALCIDGGHPVFGGAVGAGDALGTSLAFLGDLDGDGRGELAVGAPGDDFGGTNQGAIWILSLAASGVPQGALRIAEQSGGFGGGLSPNDQLGASLATLPDIDGDGIVDLAAGAPFDDDGGPERGAVWILFLEATGAVDARNKISQTTGGFGGLGGTLDTGDRFGCALATLGTLGATSEVALAVGAPDDDDGAFSQGAAWVLFLDAGGDVVDLTKISATTGGFGGSLDLGDFLGSSVIGLEDLGGDERSDLALGAVGDDDGGSNRGALWVLELDGFLPAAVTPYGCGFHPPGSFSVLAGEPTLGSTLSVGIDNPLGTQSPGSIPFVLLSLTPDPAFPCGTAIPGWGMPGLGTAGELLVGLDELVLPVLAGAPWNGPGSPAAVDVTIPPLLGLLDLEVYAQGVLFDGLGALGVSIGLADALRLRIGP